VHLQGNNDDIGYEDNAEDDQPFEKSMILKEVSI